VNKVIRIVSVSNTEKPVIISCADIGDRVFHISTNGLVFIKGLQFIGNGNVSKPGGGILVDGATSLFLEDSTFRECKASTGGAIHFGSSGDLKLMRVSLVFNKATTGTKICLSIPVVM
jgi:hypothetical protein